MIEIIGVLLVAITPWLLKTVTNVIKWLTAMRVSPERAFILRFVLALLSITAASIHAILNGTEVPADAITAFVEAINLFVEAFVFWLASTGLYKLGQK